MGTPHDTHHDTPKALCARPASIDVLLLFPPITEARLFPYLSLPRLTAYLRQAGLAVEQRDVNIDLALRIFSRTYLETYIRRKQSDDDLRTRYRIQMAKFLLRHHEGLIRSLKTKTPGTFDLRTTIRFVRQGIDLLTEDSVYMSPPESVCGIVGRARLLLHNDQQPDAASILLAQLVSEALECFRPRLLAISVPFYSQLLPSLHIAGLVKTYAPSCKVILGGPQIVLRHEELANAQGIESFVDGLGVGDGEVTLLSAVQALGNDGDLSNVPGLRLPVQQKAKWSLPKAIPLDSLPTPDFSNLPLENYLSDEVQLPLTTCVGCYWGRCCFCSYGNRSYREGSYEEMSPARIAHTCLDLVAKYGIHRINFVDENTNLNLVLRALRTINAAGERITFSTRNRLDGILLRHEFCVELAARGCVLMSAGYETNSQRLLDAMDKGVRASHYQPIIDNLNDVGIDLRLSILGGILDESPEELEASIAFLRQNEAKIGIDVMQMLVAEPQTLLTANPDAYGIRLASGEILRGNRILNFCHGRMGTKVLYPDGDTFEPRLSAFLDLFYRVQPQKNDELSPTMARFSAAPTLLHSKSLPTFDAANVSSAGTSQRSILHLEPWIRILPNSASDGRSLLVDLLWQRFFWLPRSLTVGHDGTYLESASQKSISDLVRLESLGTGHFENAEEPGDATIHF